MKKKIFRLSLIFIIMLSVSAVFITQPLFADARPDVSSFVTRLYATCLNRMPDPAGLAGWTDGLISGRVTGAQAAEGFIFSDELLSRDLSDTQFLYIMYSAFFNRPPDPGGLSSWTGVLAAGGSRHYVFSGFVNSAEFKTLCSSYGISPGSIEVAGLYTYQPAAAASAANSFASGLENSLFNSINSIRAQYGVGELVLNAELSGISRTRSSDMIARNYFSHTTPDGKNIFIILNENGFAWQFAGENIFQCWPAASGTDSAILNAWMSSSTHRDNLLNGNFRQVGIGIVDSGERRTVSVSFSN